MTGQVLKFEIHRRSTPWIFVFGFLAISLFCWLSFLNAVMSAWFAITLPLILLLGTVLVQLWPRPKVVFDMMAGQMRFEGPNVLPESTSFVDIDRIEIQSIVNENSKHLVYSLQARRAGRTSLHIYTSDVYEDVVRRGRLIADATKIEFRGADEAEKQIPVLRFKRWMFFLGIILTSAFAVLAERCAR